MSEGLRERIARAIWVADDHFKYTNVECLVAADAVIAECELRVRFGFIDGGSHPRASGRMSGDEPFPYDQDEWPWKCYLCPEFIKGELPTPNSLEAAIRDHFAKAHPGEAR